PQYTQNFVIGCFSFSSDIILNSVRNLFVRKRT
ncbi:unnamed protein product, partial [marine sediment metagenome]